MIFGAIFKGNTNSSGIFIPDSGNYVELTDSIEDTSLNGIAVHLGFHPDQIYVYFGDFTSVLGINQIILEVFTRNIIYVNTGPAVSNLSVKNVEAFLKDYSISEIFDGPATEEILTRAIENKSFNIEFLSRVLNFQRTDESGGIFFAAVLGLYLYFSEGLLIDFQSSDGFRQWARFFRDRNPQLFLKYVDLAKKYWEKDTRRVQDEVNIQSESMAGTPQGFNNEFCKLHIVEGLINFRMLLVCHYGHSITEDEFTVLNRGRYRKLDQVGFSQRVYRYNQFLIDFSADLDIIFLP